jgi:intracellular sulfur oxidation DsrE/DsrF family protein
LNRRGFLATTALAAGAPAVGDVAAVPGGTHFVERRADFDETAFATIVGRAAKIRQLYEATAFKPGVFSSIKNSFNGLHFGFGYPADAIAIVLAAHATSSVYGFADYLWQKYRLGEFFNLADAQGRPISTNVFLRQHRTFDPGADPDDDAGMYQDQSIEMLQRRGLIVLTCHTAVEEQARSLVQKGFAPAGMSAAEVAGDILTHLVAGAVVVPSMVAAIAVLQTNYRYAYLAPQ